MKPQSIKLALIVTNAGTQVRVKTDDKKVAEYAADMLDGDKFPPVDLFHDGATYLMADGFHRALAASRNEFKDIESIVHKGTKSDALKFALSANAAHGLKRTNEDKRNAVAMALAEWPTISAREIAKMCGVSNEMVSQSRGIQLSESDNSKHASSSKSTKVIGAGGKSYPATRTPKPKATIDDIADQLAASDKLSPGSAPVAPVESGKRDYSWAYGNASASPKARDLTEQESSVLREMDCCADCIKDTADKIRNGEYDPSDMADVYKQFKDTMKLLSKLPKQE